MMKFILAACFLLCIGVVYGQDTVDARDQKKSISSSFDLEDFGGGNNREPVKPTSVEDVTHIRNPECCDTRHSWQRVYYHSLPSTFSNGVTTFYFQCHLFVATNSSCVGGCNSSVVLNNYPLRVRRECDCCTPLRYHYVLPNIYCRWVVILPCGGGFKVLQHQNVKHYVALQHVYRLVGNCECLPCKTNTGWQDDKQLDPRAQRLEGQAAVDEVKTLKQVRDSDQESASAGEPSSYDRKKAYRMVNLQERTDAQAKCAA